MTTVSVNGQLDADVEEFANRSWWKVALLAIPKDGRFLLTVESLKTESEEIWIEHWKPVMNFHDMNRIYVGLRIWKSNVDMCRTLSGTRPAGDQKVIYEEFWKWHVQESIELDMRGMRLRNGVAINRLLSGRPVYRNLDDI